ncbi:hypothetical protein HYPDE_32383 [Hyphomicrobium denitrificans 1NES1]|uniref:Uncharacterized protein n=1 Tax=Hyphomicrobium denitrificans 1NES1 TaxID=670307 RepID=N0BDD4_9HYPH|nr:hypothetical protein HYPDE_32383 [Hyphomicrobium denitrificans 1NES1]
MEGRGDVALPEMIAGGESTGKAMLRSGRDITPKLPAIRRDQRRILFARQRVGTHGGRVIDYGTTRAIQLA